MRKKMLELLNSSEPLPPLHALESEQLAGAVLNDLTKMSVYSRSINVASKSAFFLGRRGGDKKLGIVSRSADIPARFEGQTRTVSMEKDELHLLIGPLSAKNLPAGAQHLADRIFLRSSSGDTPAQI